MSPARPLRPYSGKQVARWGTGGFLSSQREGRHNGINTVKSKPRVEDRFPAVRRKYLRGFEEGSVLLWVLGVGRHGPDVLCQGTRGRTSVHAAFVLPEARGGVIEYLCHLKYF